MAQNLQESETRCPACGHRAYPVVVSTAPPTGASILLCFAFLLVCACCFLGSVGMSTLAFHCERCGLRLVTEDNTRSQVEYGPTNLDPWPSDVPIPNHLRSATNLKVAISPLGLPAPVSREELIKASSRYRSLKPVRILTVDKAKFNIPYKATDASSSGFSYIIESPGIPIKDKTVTKKQDPQYLQTKCAWAQDSLEFRNSPHFRIFRHGADGTKQEISQLRLFHTGNWNAEISSFGPSSNTENDLENKSTTAKPFVKRQMSATGEGAWKATYPGILWTGSRGMLLWNKRPIVDGDKVKGKILCLLDAYDRLIVALPEIRNPSGKGKLWQMRIYAELDEDFLGEILASFTAVQVQEQRILQEHMFDSS